MSRLLVLLVVIGVVSGAIYLTYNLSMADIPWGWHCWGYVYNDQGGKMASYPVLYKTDDGWHSAGSTNGDGKYDFAPGFGYPPRVVTMKGGSSGLYHPTDSLQWVYSATDPGYPQINLHVTNKDQQQQ